MQTHINFDRGRWGDLLELRLNIRLHNFEKPKKKFSFFKKMFQEKKFNLFFVKNTFFIPTLVPIPTHSITDPIAHPLTRAQLINFPPPLALLISVLGPRECFHKILEKRIEIS